MFTAVLASELVRAGEKHEHKATLGREAPYKRSRRSQPRSEKALQQDRSQQRQAHSGFSQKDCFSTRLYRHRDAHPSKQLLLPARTDPKICFGIPMHVNHTAILSGAHALTVKNSAQAPAHHHHVSSGARHSKFQLYSTAIQYYARAAPLKPLLTMPESESKVAS